jgi:oxygen-independent coproporphyrinogen-3 oxidase
LAGIYIHIPFCKRKCHYCNFFSLASAGKKEAFLAALHREIGQTLPFPGEGPAETLYFGGGTPSLLAPQEIGNLVESATRRFGLQPGAEVTLEANPDDITPEYAAALKKTGVNRVSLGIQSFGDDDLAALNRIHTGRQAEEAVRILREAGFDNLSADLIYGIPGMDDDRWLANLDRCLALDIPHISAYALTVEEKTPLAWMIRHGRASGTDEEQGARQYLLLCARMEEAGYEHYEISNFALPGRESRHNSSYWQGVPYHGFGPAAHSYSGVARRWNVSLLSQYIEKIQNGEPVYEEEILGTDQRYDEYVMTALRTSRGVDPGLIRTRFGELYAQHFEKAVAPYLESGLAREAEGRIRLTDEGMFLSDGIAVAAFI